MIPIQEAEKKFRIIVPGIDAQVEQLGIKILRREFVLTQQNHDDTPESKKLIQFIEQRLAQPHLGYLAPDQVNDIWGGSTTNALVELGKKYNLGMNLNSPAIGSDFMRAILDGSKAKDNPIPPANTYDWLKAQVLKREHVWEDAPGLYNVVGIRGYLVAKGAVPNIGNEFNDTIALARVNSSGRKEVNFWVASTDPGLYYYHTNPINPRGCAHLVKGQYRYCPGPHNGRPAFIQDGNVTVARTNSANFTDQTKRFTDTPGARFWVNIHTAFGEWFVDYSSAGCQVIKSNGWADYRWTSFYNTLRQNTRPWFYYTLLESKDLI